MALPVTIPNTFANATSSIPLSQLDTNFSTLANAVNGLNSGSETLANLKATTANVGVLTVTGNATIGDASTDTVTLNSTLTANTAVIFAAGTSAAPSITTTGDTNTGIFFPAADTIAFAEGGAEAMRIDSSGNVGIGLTSPSVRLDVGADSATPVIFAGAAGGNDIVYTFRESRGTAASPSDTGGEGISLSFQKRATSSWASPIAQIYAAGGGSGADGYLAFLTKPSGGSATERMRIDSSGNVGIGVTPSAWVGKAIEVGDGAALWSSATNQAQVLNNSYFDGSVFKYRNTAAASRYRQFGNSHEWYSAPSGTAGNAITFTQVLAVEKDKSLALQGATSQSGTGITFPATQSASSDANTLDDYEEGTWTPVLGGDGGQSGQTYSARNGRYTKVGNICFVEFDVTLSNKGTITGTGNISGLPFTCANVGDLSQGGGSITYFDGLGVNVVSIVPGPQPNQTYLYPRYLTAAAANMTPSTAGSTLWNNNTRLAGMCWYQVA